MASGNMKTAHRDRVDLTIVVVSYNTERITSECVSSIFGSLQGDNIAVEVIVIDNASTDGSIAQLRRLAANHPEIRLVENSENVGFGRANNQGVRIAKADTVLLLNSDTVILENAIEKMYRFYRDHSDCYPFLGAKLLNQDLSPQPSAGAFFTVPVVFGALFLKGDYWGLTRSSPDDVRTVDWVSGACIMTQKTHFLDLGGFDESIFMYMEEVDLLYRAKQSGLKTGFFPDARFIHLGSASSNGKTYPILQVFKGFSFFYRKHYGPLSLLALKCMLQLKALVSLAVGKITGNEYLTRTYAEAYRLARMA
jgi:GT2 family glycosyltransferase